MDAVEVSILINPHPRRHIVYPCADRERATNAVYLFASSGLAKREAVVLIVGDSDCEPIKQQLKAQAFDLGALLASGQLECIRAEDLLLTLMSSGVPDERLFKTIITTP